MLWDHANCLKENYHLSKCGQKDLLLQEWFWAFLERKKQFSHGLHYNEKASFPNPLLSFAVSPELYSIIIVGIPPLFFWRGEGWASSWISKKKDLIASQSLKESYCWPFSGGCSFYIKSFFFLVKINWFLHEIFNDKKVQKQKCLFLS